MEFLKAIFYLTIFPGLLTCVFGGVFVCLIWGWANRSIKKRRRCQSGQSSTFTLESLKSEALDHIGRGSVYWVGSSVCFAALSWAMCITLGVLDGDIFILYAIILLYLGASALSILLLGSRSKISVATVIRGVPPCVLISLIGVLVVAYFTTGELALTKIRLWQNINGPVLLSAEGGILHIIARVMVFIAFLLSVCRVLAMQQGSRCIAENGEVCMSRDEPEETDVPDVHKLLRFSFLFLLEFLLLSVFLGLPLRPELDAVLRFVTLLPLVLLTSSISACITDQGAKADFAIVGTAVAFASFGIILVSLA